MKSKLILALLLLCPFSAATTTVSGNIKTLGTTVVTNSFVRFRLHGCGGNQPRVTGVAIMPANTNGDFYFDFKASSTGVVSGTLYSTRDAAGTGNGEIECGGSYTSVWYGMQVYQNSVPGPEIPVHAKNGATLDVANVTPITVNPVVMAPTGDSTYLRLDGGNSPITGAVTFQGNDTFTGTNTFDSLTASSATVTTGNVTQLTATSAAVASGTFDKINNVWYMGGTAYPCTQAGLTAVLTAANAVGGEVNAKACTSVTISAANTIGDGTHGVSLLVPNSGTWTLTGITDGTSCFFNLKSGSSIIGNGATNGGSKFTLRGDTASVNADSMICTDASVYTRVQGGILLYNPAPGTPGTYVNGLIHWRMAFDGSTVRDVTVSNYAGIGVFVDSPCCGAAFDKVVINGNNQAGARPFVFDTTTSNNSASWACYSCSIDHAADDQHEIEIKQTGTGKTGPVNFYSLYIEGDTTPQTVSHVEITKAWGGVNFFGGAVAVRNNTETVPAIHLATGSGGIVNVYGMDFWEGPTPSNRIADDISGVTVTTPSTSVVHTIPYYSTYNASIRRIHSTTNLSGGTATVTFGTAFQVAPICTATDQTAANPVAAAPTATQLVLTGTTTDTIAWTCSGNPN